MKVCPKCKTEYAATKEFFPPSKVNRDGLHSYCRKCQYELNREWRKKNPARAKALRKAWAEKNREKEYLRLKAARERDPERARARVRKSYYKNHAKRLAARKAYRINNLEKEREYSRNYVHPNPPAVKEQSARCRYKKRGVFVDPIDYGVILQRDRSICHICKKVVAKEDLTFDHVIPIARGGAHTYENVKVCHYVCNRAKHAKIL